MEFVFVLLEKMSDAGAFLSLPILLGFCYVKVKSLKTKESYTIQNLTDDWFGKESDHGVSGVLVLSKWCYIIGFMSTVGLIFFIDRIESVPFLAIKFVSITLGLVIVFANKIIPKS